MKLYPFHFTMNIRRVIIPVFASLLLVAVTSCGDPKEKDKDKEKQTGRKAAADTIVSMLAALRNTPDGIEVLFNDHQAVYTMSADTGKALLADHRPGMPLKIVTDSIGRIIELLQPTEADIKMINTRFADSVKSPRPPEPVTIKDIDTTRFNLINLEIFKKWRIPVCSKVIPDLATAQKIFDFCAAQSCNLPGPFSVNPCIPFQYVIDGCYARAHKMRWIIETKYNYCTNKVFSFANQNNDVLAVKANKWGGCCVTWWYHVAPLVYVKVNGQSVAYVIDPGMFNGPVTLSTWLQAQENKTCSARAKVSMYSIQPSSAYSPANYAGTSFTTDPNYVATDNTLTLYRNRRTCP